MYVVGLVLLSYFVLVLKHAYHGRGYARDVFDARGEDVLVSPITTKLFLGFVVATVFVACPFIIIVEGLLDGDPFAVLRNS